MIRQSLADIARETVVTIDSPEEGEATERKAAIAFVPVRLTAICGVPESGAHGAYILGIGEDGSPWILNHGATAWDELPVPARRFPNA